MKVFVTIVVFLLAALSILAGGAKVLQTPKELEFLQGFGLSVALIIIFGVVQLVGGVLLLLPKTRTLGAAMVAVGFLVSAILVFATGNLPFGFVSLVPVLLSGLVLWQTVRATHNKF